MRNIRVEDYPFSEDVVIRVLQTPEVKVVNLFQD